MKVTKDNGLVTISLSEKDAEALAIVVLVAVDRQEEVDADDVGVTDEHLTHGYKIAEAVNKRFEEMGFHAIRELPTDDDGEEVYD